MTQVYDVAVVGAGAMGSAAAWALSKAGRDVVALEQFELGHTRGGSHGATRIFRVGTEQAHYLDMAERARGLWDELQAETGTQLRTITGAIEHGMTAETAQDFCTALSARGIDHAVIDAADAMERWPGFRFDGPVLHQSGGAIIHADRAVAGLQNLAVKQGATFRPHTRVDGLKLTDSAAPVVLETAGGAILARHVIVTVGPWAAKLIGGTVTLPTITVTQEQPRLFEPVDASHEWPCFVHWREGTGEFDGFESYGLLEAGAGIKVGLHANGPTFDPDQRDFEPEPNRDEALHAYVKNWFPGLNPDQSIPISCVYDNTDNGDFIIDRFGALTVATGFNGEGFKFVPLIGQLLRDLATGAADPPEMFTVARHLSSTSQ